MIDFHLHSTARLLKLLKFQEWILETMRMFYIILIRLKMLEVGILQDTRFLNIIEACQLTIWLEVTVPKILGLMEELK